MGLTIPGKLPLDDPRWLEWRSHLPQRLLAALASSSPKPGDDAWDRLLEELVHGGLTAARYAAVPYVVELAHRVPNVDAGDLWISLGWALSGHELLGPPVPNALRPAMDAALDLAETRCVEALLSEAWSDDVAVPLAIAALVFAKHPVGRLLAWSGLIGTRMPEGAMHCSVCGTDSYFAVVGGGLVAYCALEAFSEEADPTQPRRMNALVPVGEACDSPWRAVGNLLCDLGPELENEWAAELATARTQAEYGVRGGDDRAVLCLVGALLLARGAPGTTLLRLAGGVRCPACGATHDLTDVLLDLHEPGQR
ncbi:MAG: hypothetical protein H6721_04935 [Sandaracinus sp.]|nr:hypothetical protein [Sandaracinus sp.]MCB9631473.1 hypothetical protein [Sandaracinus sp.]